MRLLLLILFFLPSTAPAQTNAAGVKADELIERHKKVNAMKMAMPGFRIQIYFGNDRNRAQEIRTEFLQYFGDTPAYLIYQQPNFKVRVGDFRTRLEASGFLKKLESHYKSAFIVPDDVKLPEL